MMTNFRQEAIRPIWGIPLTAAVMAGLILALLYAYVHHLPMPRGDKELWSAPLIFIGTALGGASGVRLARLAWRQTILAALLAGIGLTIPVRSLFGRQQEIWDIGVKVGESPISWFGSLNTLGSVMFFLLVIAMGVFLLPLFEPAVRKAGIAPSSRKMLLAAFFLVPLMIWAGRVDIYRGLIFHVIFPLLMAVIALVLSLANLTQVGALLGGLAVLIPFFLLALQLLGFGL